MYKHSIRLIMFVSLLLCSKVFSAETENLSIKAKPHKNILLIGEPLYISSSIKNSGKSVIELQYTGGPVYSVYGYGYKEGWGVVLISEDGETYKTYRRWRSGAQLFYKVDPIKLERGQEQTNEFTVLYGHYGDDYNNKRLVLNEEKPYFVCVEYLYSVGTPPVERVWSAPFRIDVVKPQGEDLAMWERLRVDTRYGELVQGLEGITLQQVEIDRLSDLCEKYPKTIYTPYLALSLGRYYYTQSEHWRHQGKDYTKDTVENKEKALRYLEMIHSITKDQTLIEKADIILKRLKPSEEIVREKGIEITIKGEGPLIDIIYYIEKETGMEIRWHNIIFDKVLEPNLELEKLIFERYGKYSFKAKVKKGDKEEMLKISKSFLKEALTQLKLSDKISIKEKDGKLWLIEAEK